MCLKHLTNLSMCRGWVWQAWVVWPDLDMLLSGSFILKCTISSRSCRFPNLCFYIWPFYCLGYWYCYGPVSGRHFLWKEILLRGGKLLNFLCIKFIMFFLVPLYLEIAWVIVPGWRSYYHVMWNVYTIVTVCFTYRIYKTAELSFGLFVFVCEGICLKIILAYANMEVVSLQSRCWSWQNIIWIC